MAILVSCPCGQCYPVREEFAGRQVRCTACQGVLTIPAPVGLPTPQNPAPFEAQPTLALPPPRPSRAPLVIAATLILLLVGATAWLLLNLDTVADLLNGGPRPQAS